MDPPIALAPRHAVARTDESLSDRQDFFEDIDVLQTAP
jgi:hypothetical protein